MSGSAIAALWDDVALCWRTRGTESVWRITSDAINSRLLERWLPASGGSVLKTDLFDELVGVGLVPALLERFESVTAVDVSPEVIGTAAARHPHLCVAEADVRHLPFGEAAFDAVVSNSTLDHFPSVDDVAVALSELHRVLRSAGTLLVTLDNPANPFVAVRNALPEAVRTRTRLFPFAVGATCGIRRLRRLLEEAGFDVVDTAAIGHFPRVLTVLGGHFVDRRCDTPAKLRSARFLTGFEALDALPTRFVTGHFVAALARKR